jgi:hypothetical protein
MITLLEKMYKTAKDLLAQQLNNGYKMVVGIWTFFDDFSSSKIQTLYISIGVYSATPNHQRVSH